MASSQYDWESIENEYVIGYRKISESTGLEVVTYPTYKELAIKYGVSEDYVRKRGADGEWAELRSRLKEQQKHNTLKAALSGEYSESAQFDARILNSANRLLGVVEAFFGQYEYLVLGPDGNFRYVPPEKGYSEEEDDPIKNIKVSDLKGLVEVLDRTQTLVRRTLGEPNKTQKALSAEDSKEDVDRLIKQRDSLLRQQDGLAYQIEQLKKELDE